ncbi:hypothetical protein SMJ63A_80052 [Stenotrophomonas geniculata]
MLAHATSPMARSRPRDRKRINLRNAKFEVKENPTAMSLAMLPGIPSHSMPTHMTP